MCGLIEGFKLPHQYEADGLIAAAAELEMTGCCNKVNVIAPDLSLESTFNVQVSMVRPGLVLTRTATSADWLSRLGWAPRSIETEMWGET